MSECICPGAGGVEPDCPIHGDNVRSAALRSRLDDAERAGLRRPWELIYDHKDGYRFDGTLVPDGAIDPRSFRIVDADCRLIARIGADPEQVLTPSEMVLIVEAVNAL